MKVSCLICLIVTNFDVFIIILCTMLCLANILRLCASSLAVGSLFESDRKSTVVQATDRLSVVKGKSWWHLGSRACAGMRELSCFRNDVGKIEDGVDEARLFVLTLVVTLI